MDMIRLLWPILVIELILKAVALKDLSTKETAEVKYESKLAWAAIIVLIGTFGPLLYLFWGKNEE